MLGASSVSLSPRHYDGPRRFMNAAGPTVEFKV